MATTAENSKGVQKSFSEFTNNICQVIRRLYHRSNLKENVGKTETAKNDHDLKGNMEKSGAADNIQPDEIAVKAQSASLSGMPNNIWNFTSDLCKIFTTSSEENYICSSLSAHIALSMAAYGADNNTAVEMRKVLHIPDDDSEFLEIYQNLIDILSTAI